MSYEPTNWKDGDLVTSAKLNKLEQGVAKNGGILIAHKIQDGEDAPTLDKTWQEIHDADVCYIIERDEEWSSCELVQETEIYNDKYLIRARDFIGESQIFSADSPNSTLTLNSNTPSAS